MHHFIPGLLLALATLTAAAQAPAVAPVSAPAAPAVTGAAHAPADEAAVLAVVNAADAGWATRNVAQALTEYADDAYWINAFGIEWHGRADIQKFLTRLFANPGFNAAKITKPRTVLSVRFISPDVAVVHDYAESTGQLTNSGQLMSERKTHIFRVVVKRQGRWLTDSFQVMDERERQP